MTDLIVFIALGLILGWGWAIGIYLALIVVVAFLER